MGEATTCGDAMCATEGCRRPAGKRDEWCPAARKRVRSAVADRMGFAWEPEELADMTVAEAREILRVDDEARASGTIGNEDSGTLDHARRLVAGP